MLVAAIASFFKYKLVGSIIILGYFSKIEQINIAKRFFDQGVGVEFSSNASVLDSNAGFQVKGILYFGLGPNVFLEMMNKRHFSKEFKWLFVGDDLEDGINLAPYDSDMAIVATNGENCLLDCDFHSASFQDIYVHPRDGATVHDWAHWTQSNGLNVTYESAKVQRRKNLRKYHLKISAPVAHYSEEFYNGTFVEYLLDLTVPDSGLRCGYGAASLLVEALNASEELIPALLWNSDVHNSSMLLMLESGHADLSGGVLRLMSDRMSRLDYIMPIWLFSVGFTYLAERESSSNMYVEPFTASVWCGCLVIGVILALAQRITSRKPEEKEGAFIGVMATWLQQDASAVPEGLSGRWTFIVLSVCSMLVHAYYTSAIVSSLMSTGRGGPQTLRALADSRYAIASDDHDFIRLTMFDVETPWEELEYLKKKKLTSAFYQDIRHGVQLVRQGYTAYHAEYLQIFPHLNTLSDDEICKMQHVDTIPEVMTWITTSPKGQYTDLLRIRGAWLHETGLAKRLISRMQIQPPPCRAALLAERVTVWDVIPLLAVTALAAILSLIVLAMEIMVAKWNRQYTSHKYF